jgi:hypothetical protein
MTRETWSRAALCAALTLSAGRAAAQASPSEMSAFPMLPPSGLVATKTFGYVGDYGYYTAPASSVPGTGAAASDYRYVRYRGVAGKRVFVYGAWGPTPIPPPSGGGDSCGHAHASWGVWGRWEFSFPFYGTIAGWTNLGGGGMSGVRNPAGKCVLTPNNPLRTIDPRFGWGQTFKSFDLRGMTFVTDLVVGALSNTHGWGSCSVPPGSFRACHEPSYIIGYTLP